MRALCLLTVLLGLLCGVTCAQDYTGDFIIGGSAYNTSDGVFRVNRTTGKLTTIAAGLFPDTTSAVWEVIMAENNKDFFAMSVTRARETRIFRVDPTGSTITTVWNAGKYFKSPANMYLDQNGMLMVYDTGWSTTISYLYAVNPATKAVSTVAILPKGDYSYGSAVRDLHTGDDLVWVNDTVFRVDRTTGAVTTPVTIGTRVARMGFAQDTLTSKAYGGTCCSDTIWQVDLATGASKILVGPQGFWANYGLKFDRRVQWKVNKFFNAYAHGGSNNGVAAIDTTGKVTKIVQWKAGKGVPLPYSLEIEGSAEVQPILVFAPNDRQIRLSFPGFGGKAYVGAIGISGILPGVPLKDGRVIHLVIDQIAIASLHGILNAYLPARVGILDKNGEARAGVSMNALGKLVKGLSVTYVVVVVDSAAPSGIAVIAEPYTIKME